MPSSGLRPETVLLLNRMVGPAPSDPRFVGPAVDPARIDALALGDLWGTAQATQHAGGYNPNKTLAVATAHFVLDLGKTMEPAFRASVCRTHLEEITRETEAEPKTEFEFRDRFF